MTKEFREISVVIVDDDCGHRELISRNLRRSGVLNEIIKLSSGQEALDYITKSSKFENRKATDYLLILDLNMPEISGIDILSKIKSDENLKKIPIIVLTTTDSQEEINYCYKLGCNVYLTKPVDQKSFSEALNKLGLFVRILSIPELEE